jgi:hypothetical protein
LANQCLKIQVAFQGGGAKIFALIAAAEVLKSFGTVRMEAPPEAEPGVHPGGPWDLDELTRAMTPEGFIPYGWAGNQVPRTAVFKAYFLKEPDPHP